MRERIWSRLAVGMALVGAAWTAPTSASGAASTTAAPRLAALLARSAVVVSGHVSRVQPFDYDRVRVIHFTVDRTVKGQARLGATGGSIEIVEMRDRGDAPDLLSGGDRAVVFLKRAGRGSYLDQTLGVGRRWEAVQGRTGVIADRDATVVNEVAALVDRLADRSRNPPATAEERATARRTWTFDAVGGRHPALVEDGAQELVGLPGLASNLSAEERMRLEKAVRREDLPPRIRAALIRAIGEAGLTSLVPALALLTSDDAQVVDAAWQARGALGDPPARAEVERRLRDADAQVRAVAVGRYAATYPQEALAGFGAFLAGEKDPDVRIAALEALGRIEKVEAAELIEDAFVADDELVVRQAAGRVLFERGGSSAAESFVRLAYSAPPEGQRHAVVLLMALGRPEDAATIEKLRESHPDAKVRELVEHGFPDPHH